MPHCRHFDAQRQACRYDSIRRLLAPPLCRAPVGCTTVPLRPSFQSRSLPGVGPPPPPPSHGPPRAGAERAGRRERGLAASSRKTANGRVTAVCAALSLSGRAEWQLPLDPPQSQPAQSILMRRPLRTPVLRMNKQGWVAHAPLRCVWGCCWWTARQSGIAKKRSLLVSLQHADVPPQMRAIRERG